MAELATVARPYAEAVFRLARETGATAHWSEMLALAAGVAESPDFAELAANPKLTVSQVGDLMVGICGDGLDGEGVNLMRLLAENKRLVLLPAIRDQFETFRAEAEGEVEAVIQTAYALEPASRDALAARLAARYGKRVRVSESVNPDLIGGAVITVGDQIFDASVAGRLAAMAVALKN